MSCGQDFVNKVSVLLLGLGVIMATFGVLQKVACADVEESRETRLYCVSDLCKILLCIICSEVIWSICYMSMLTKIPVKTGVNVKGNIGAYEGVAAGGNVGMYGYATAGINDGSGIFWKICLLSVIFACLLFATVTDIETQMVYDYTWWIAGAAIAVMLYIARPCRENIIELLLFILLQEFFFALFYGRADCHAFAVCAALEGCFGMGMREYLVHMLLSFMILAVVQLVRGNVGRNGNLKIPVAFLPYITIGCGLMFFIYGSKDFLHIYANLVDFSP